LVLSDSEKKILLNTPGEVIEKMVVNTFVPRQHVSTFMSARTAAMLSMVIAASVLLPFQVYSTGAPAETAISIQREEATAALIEQRLRNVQEALEQYKEDRGVYPSTLEWVTGNPLEGYLNPAHLYDPWYRKFHYKGVKGEGGLIGNYRLECLGQSVESALDNIYSPIDTASHRFSGEIPLRILFPQPDDRIMLPRVDDSPVLLAAEHQSAGASLDWYLNSRKIGSTVNEHALVLPEGIPAGGHWLSVIDEEENYCSVSFIVERHLRF
jgi:hypothetical protein